MWRKESSEPGAGITWSLLALGETPSHLVTGNSRATRPGESQRQPVIWATGTLARLLAPEGGRAAQRTLRNRRDGAARLGEAPPSQTWRGLVPLCPTGQIAPATTRRPGHGHSPSFASLAGASHGRARGTQVSREGGGSSVPGTLRSGVRPGGCGVARPEVARRSGSAPGSTPACVPAPGRHKSSRLNVP
jgi:hypothetical protein